MRENSQKNDDAPATEQFSELRYRILAALLKRPVGIYALSRASGLTSYPQHLITQEVLELFKQHIVIPRDRKFFVRNLPYANSYLARDRRFVHVKK